MDEVWQQVQRSNRDALLAASDWTQLADVTLTNRDEWIAYRQQLRDITNDPNWPNVTFPESPDA